MKKDNCEYNDSFLSINVRVEFENNIFIGDNKSLRQTASMAGANLSIVFSTHSMKMLANKEIVC